MAAGLFVFAQIAISVTAPDTMRIREPGIITVRVEAAGTEAPRVIAPPFSPFLAARRSETTRSDVQSGRAWSTAIVRYELRATRSGEFTLLPFTARLGGRSAVSSRTTIVVKPTPVDTAIPEIVARAPVAPTGEVGFHALALPETVYVGQQATYQVGVFLGNDVRVRMRRNPEFIPPELRSMLAYDLAGGQSTFHTRISGDQRYDVHVFRRALFPLAPGRFVMPPARLVYSVPLGASFFSREESRTLRAESTVVVAIEPPTAARPDDYAGAVGVLSVSSHVDSAHGRVGDPLLLTVRVTGTGNVKLFPRPRVDIGWGAIVPSDERVRIDSGALLVRGTKEFDWIVTPQREGRVGLPDVRYWYFNPYTEKYELAVAAADSLAIGPGALAPRDSVMAVAPLAIRAEFRGSLPPPLATRPAFWLLLLLAPLPALGVVAARMPRRARRRISAADTLRRLASSRRSGDAAEIRRTFLRALADRLGLGVQTLTRPGEVDHLLRRSGVPAPLARETESFLASLDAALYARRATPASNGGERRAPGSAASRALLGKQACQLYEAIDREARVRRAGASAGTALLLALAFTLSVASALAARYERDESVNFATGVQAYARRDYTAAATIFADVATRVPRAADAWANAGTAAWMMREPAHAALGWQRALRLEPAARDVRTSLALLPIENAGSIAGVRPVPPTPLLVLVALLWVGGWLWLGVARLRNRRAGHGPPAAMLAAFAIGALALHEERLLAAGDLHLVMSGATVRAVPALGGEREADLALGEVVREVRRDGVWTHVRADGGREGWVESVRLAPLARR